MLYDDSRLIEIFPVILYKIHDFQKYSPLSIRVLNVFYF